MFLADLITNSKRLKFTRRHIRVLLAYARETRGEDIPTLKQLKKAQVALKHRLGNPTTRHVSPNGHVYYMNRIVHGIAQDFANPHLRKHMHFYPHLNNKRMSEVWHGAKMLTSIPDHLLSPMICYNNKVFYVNELVECENGWFLPQRWIMKGEKCKPYAVGYVVRDTLEGLRVFSERRVAVAVSTFRRSFPELVAQQAVPKFDDASKVFRQGMPHLLRKIAGLRSIYAVPILLFMDDISGNVSKQWNKHISCYISNGALTRQILHSEYSIHFVLTSKHAEASELMYGIREERREGYKNPSVAFDSETREEVLFWPYPLFSAADNPMQAEQCSCQLQKANVFCRTCLVGGSTEFRESAAGYASLFSPGEKRTPAQTLDRVNKLLNLSLQPSNKTQIKEHARDWGIKDALGQLTIDRLVEMGQKMRLVAKGGVRSCESDVVATLKKELDLARQKGCINAFLDMDSLGFNVHEDTPMEILHTVLLGVVKYFWGQTVFILTKSHQMRLLETRLASINVSGLNIDSVLEKYMCQYTGSLVGKHFKILSQVMSFACHDLVQPDLLEVWLLLGRLTSLLWYTEIEDVDLYTTELQEVIDDFLTATARCSPSIIIQKPKFHFLVHLPMYIKRFGPAILFSTERYESFHTVFRAGSLFSNHHAPSRDIAEYFVGLDRLKHICSGGY
ncbi:hypothetical protein FS749_007718 [Ceratobasidium sp. UAMH 11750]|nr:hypothetical protein FS749_007718 [Ceratobasidium sp. UAMH 11750]